MLLMSERINSYICITFLFISVPISVSSDWKLETRVQTRREIDCKHLPDSQSNVTEIHAALLKFNISTAWLSIRRFRGKWKWLDGSGAGKQTGPPGRHRARHQGGCALLDAWNNRIYAFGCHLPAVTAICQAKNCRVCKGHGRQKTLCQHISNYCHYLVNATSWYHARSLCSEYEGSKLAVLSDSSLRRSVSRAIVNSQHFKNNGNYFWVGLHKEDWKDENGKGRSISSSRFQMVKNAFRSPKGECLVATVNEKTLVWRVVHCSEKHPVLCKTENNQDIGNSQSFTPITSVKTSLEEANKEAIAHAPQKIPSTAYRKIPDPRILYFITFYLSYSGALN